MSHIIQNGKGKKYFAEVDSTNKLMTRSISEPSSIEALDNGDQYFLHSAVMNITNDNNTYIAYLENTYSARNIIITAVEYSFTDSKSTGPVTNPTQDCIVRIRRNPSGPSFSQGWFTNDADFGSANELQATALTAGFGTGGGNDGTFTDNGSLMLHDLINSGKIEHKKLLFDQLKLRPGNSIGFGWEPPTGNIDQTVHINMVLYIKD
jgi:hypothetical protein